MRVRPTLQLGHGAARMRPEIGTENKCNVFNNNNNNNNKCVLVRHVTLA